ncbi:MAG: LysM peptidoglycan-binding domain-containing protein, partial [Candidatus Binatia bacterium]
IKETFVIHNPEANKLPAWNRSGQNRLQEARGWNKLTVARRGYRSCAPATLNWGNYRFGSARIDLVGHLLPMLTVRYAEGKPEICYVAALFLDTVAEGGDAQDEARATSFQKLCEEILRWTLAAARGGKIERTKLDKSPVSKYDLDAVILALGDHEKGVPISAADTSKFMGMCFSLNLSVPPDKKAATDADQPKNLAAFPMVPELHLKVAGAEDLDYSFNDFTTLSETYVADLRAHFDSLAEQVEEELERNAAPRKVAPPTNARESMASFCFGDYFLLLARQMIQAARDAIGNFQYPITPGESIFDIVGKVNQWSPKGKVEDYPEFSPEELFRANADHPLNAGKPIHLDNLTYQVAEGDTLSGIVERHRPPTGKGFEAEDLAKKNAQSSEDILVAGTEIKIGETKPYLVKSGDTLQTIANELSNGDVAKLVKDFKLDSLPGFLKPLAVLELPNFVHQTVATDTLASIAARYHIKVDHLTQRDAGVQRQRQAPQARRSRRSGRLTRGAPSASETNLSIQDLFASSDEDLRYLRVTHRERFTVEALLKQIRRSNGSMQLSGMASRYMLHGLRLPTDGITPKDEKTRLRPVMGLYELTGQQFPIRGPVKDFSLTLSKVQKKPGWIKFADDLATTELTFAVGIEEVKRIGAVEQAAASGIEPGLTQLGALDAATATPATFPLRSTMRWQCAPAADFELSYGQAPKTHDELRMWWLPEGIFASGGSGVTSAAAPRLSVQIASYDDAKSETTAAESKAFEYATLVDFTVKKLVPSIQSATTRATYELVGAGDQGIIRLERLLRAEASPLSGTILYQDPSAAEDSSPRALESSAAAVTTFISQVNLTTYTQPRAVAGAAGTGASLDWRDFAQRLWRGSITRSGGFYLYYSDSEDQGLPERIFDDRGEARLWVLLRYPKPTEADRQMRPSAYMNCVITGDAIDVKEESSSAVFLEAAPTPKEVEVKVGESLQSIGDEHFMSPIDVAMENSDRRLVIGYPITIDGGSYMVGSPGAAAGSRLLD